MKPRLQCAHGHLLDRPDAGRLGSERIGHPYQDNNNQHGFSTQVHISNAATATETVRLTFSGHTLACFGDDPTILLPDGDILAGNIFKNAVYRYTRRDRHLDALQRNKYLQRQKR